MLDRPVPPIVLTTPSGEIAMVKPVATAAKIPSEITLPPAEVVKATQDGFKPGVRRRWGLTEWPALLRKLDRIDPSYRD